MSSINVSDGRVIVDLKNLSETYCAFEHQATLTPGQPPEVVFVGMCKLNHVYTLAEARKNTEWIKLFDNGGQIMIRILAVSADLALIRRFVIEHLGKMEVKPRCNRLGMNLKGVTVPIRCSNGKLYRTQKDASYELGVAQSSLSRHLQGHLNAVGGLTFWYEPEGAREFET